MRLLRPLLVFSTPVVAGVLAFLLLWPGYFLPYEFNPYEQYHPWTDKWLDTFKALFLLSYGVHLALSLAVAMLVARRLRSPLALTALTMAAVLVPLAFFNLRFLDYMNACDGIAFPLEGGVSQFGDVFSCEVD